GRSNRFSSWYSTATETKSGRSAAERDRECRGGRDLELRHCPERVRERERRRQRSGERLVQECESRAVVNPHQRARDRREQHHREERGEQAREKQRGEGWPDRTRVRGLRDGRRDARDLARDDLLLDL